MMLSSPMSSKPPILHASLCRFYLVNHRADIIFLYLRGSNFTIPSILGKIVIPNIEPNVPSHIVLATTLKSNQVPKRLSIP